jgi:exodeoxyribonuclease V gamma subunit
VLRLVYSNRTEELLEELAHRVRAAQAGTPLVPVPIVVSSGSVERAVRIHVARACGIAANLEVTLFTRFAARLLETTSAVRVADAPALSSMALALLLDETLLAAAPLVPLRRYLDAAGGDAEALDVRRVQLAERIGRLFEEYTYSRPDMLASWSKGARHETGADPETEAWQRHLYQAMMGERGFAAGIAARGGQRVVALHDAVTELGAAPLPAMPRGLHVFALSPFARTFHHLLEKLAATTDVHVYGLSPCEGFWEDVDPRDPALLHQWGRPGREHVRALNAAAAFDHDDRFVDPLDVRGAGREGGRARTLLATVQSDILRRERREASPAPSAFDGDESLVVLEHASIRRELEAVASEIWRLLDADEALRFDDIALLLPDVDRESYLAHLPVVFREAHDLPFQVVGAPLAGDSRIVEAIELLLALPSGRYTRQEVLGLALHPAVIASLDDVDPGRWLAWCDALGVVHGADKSDHDGTYIRQDMLNWDQGLRRLALGAFMAGDASDARSPFEVGGESYVPLEVGTSEMRDAAALGALLRSLLADAAQLTAAPRTPSEWAERISTLIETYVSPVGDEEEEDLASCLRCVRSIADPCFGEVRVSYATARDLVLRRLVKLPSGRGGEGVVASTLSSLRPLPFRVVFACGMGEGHFPSPEADDPLDLRWARRREGDVTARERDKYAFLELLLGARDRFYASYVSRDPLTGDALAPSSVVQDILATASSRYGRQEAGMRVRHPLRHWDPGYFPAVFGARAHPATTEQAARHGAMYLPEAREEAVTLALRRAIESSGARVTREDVAARAADDPAWRTLADHLGLYPPAATASRAMATRISVPMYALVKFLEFPLQGWARFRVGLDEIDEDDAMAREDEPFETPSRDETLLLRDVFFGGPAALAAAYDAAARERELRGTGPSGVFARGEREDHVRTLEAWSSALTREGVGLDAIEIHRFGRAGEHARAQQPHPSLVLDLQLPDRAGVVHLVKVDVSGRTLPIGNDAEASVLLHRRLKRPGDKDWDTADLERMALRAFIDHAVLSAAGVTSGRPRRCVTVIASREEPDEPLVRTTTFSPMTRDEATAWLRGVVTDLLGAPHAYFFPCEAVFVHQGKDPEGPIVPVLQEAAGMLRDTDEFPALRSSYGPVPRVRQYPLPDEQTARAMVRARFGAFFEHASGTRRAGRSDAS